MEHRSGLPGPTRPVIQRIPVFFRQMAFLCLLVVCLFPIISPPVALLLGFLVAQVIGHPYAHLNSKATHLLLQMSVVGLGFGMNVESAFRASKDGLWLTIASIGFTLIVSLVSKRLLKLEGKTSYLISAGTAICGGSAIAAVAPAIKANEQQTSVALGVVFILNAVALFVFPFVGHQLHLSQTQFGLWCAIAIHDTSSVVGAADKFGTEALEIATTVKLARALWILPVALSSVYLFKSTASTLKLPYFIGLFLLAILVNSYTPAIEMMAPYIVHISKAGLTVTLFLIGSGLSPKVLKAVGLQPMLHGVILWVLISVTSLWAILVLL